MAAFGFIHLTPYFAITACIRKIRGAILLSQIHGDLRMGVTDVCQGYLGARGRAGARERLCALLKLQSGCGSARGLGRDVFGLQRGKCGMQKHPEQQNSIGFVIPSKQNPDVMSWIYDDLCGILLSFLMGRLALKVGIQLIQ